MVFEKDVGCAMNGVANAPRCAGNGEYNEKVKDPNRVKAIKVYWACLQNK